MRAFAKISSEFWISPMGKKIKTCSLEAKVVALYLMTCRHANMIGFYYLPLLFITHETGISLEGVSKGLKSLIEIEFCSYDSEVECVWIQDMAAHELGQLKKNDNRVKYINSVYKKLPSTFLLNDFYEKYSDLLCLDFSSVVSAKPLRSQEKKQEQDQDKKQDKEKEIPISLGREQPKIPTEKNQHDDEEKSEHPISCVKKIDPIVFTIPLRQGKTRIITQHELDDWQKDYLTVNVRQEIRHLIAWNHANPDRQKTERGIKRHIQGWLAHTQQKQTQTNHGSPRQLSTWEHNMAVMQAVLEEDYASQ